MKEPAKPASVPAAPAKPLLGAFEVVGTTAGAGTGGPQTARPAKPPTKVNKKPGRRPTFIEPLEGRTIIG